MSESDDESVGIRRRRDAELGSAMRAWASEAKAVPAEIEGPLEAPGMDPRWILKIRSEHLDADVLLFYGPFLDVSASRPSDPDAGLFVGGAEHLSDDGLVEMLNDLGRAALGDDLPSWLRIERAPQP
jgi:hypothetical protein